MIADLGSASAFASSATLRVPMPKLAPWLSTGAAAATGGGGSSAPAASSPAVQETYAAIEAPPTEEHTKRNIAIGVGVALVVIGGALFFAKKR